MGPENEQWIGDNWVLRPKKPIQLVPDQASMMDLLTVPEEKFENTLEDYVKEPVTLNVMNPESRLYHPQVTDEHANEELFPDRVEYMGMKEGQPYQEELVSSNPRITEEYATFNELIESIGEEKAKEFLTSSFTKPEDSEYYFNNPNIPMPIAPVPKGTFQGLPFREETGFTRSEPMDIVMQLLKAPVYDTDVPGISFVTQGKGEDWTQDENLHGGLPGLWIKEGKTYPPSQRAIPLDPSMADSRDINEIEQMTPNEFLQTAGTSEEMDDGAYYEELMRRAMADEDMRFVMPRLSEFFPDSPPGHDGRHRMLALRNLGHGDTPVPVSVSEEHMPVQTGEPMDIAFQMLKAPYLPESFTPIQQEFQMPNQKHWAKDAVGIFAHPEDPDEQYQMSISYMGGNNPYVEVKHPASGETIAHGTFRYEPHPYDEEEPGHIESDDTWVHKDHRRKAMGPAMYYFLVNQMERLWGPELRSSEHMTDEGKKMWEREQGTAEPGTSWKAEGATSWR